MITKGKVTLRPHVEDNSTAVQLGVDSFLLQGYPPPPQQWVSAGAHLYNWVNRDIVESSFLSKERMRLNAGTGFETVSIG